MSPGLECMWFLAGGGLYGAAEQGWEVERLPELHLYGLTAFCFKWVTITVDAFIQIQL